MSELAPDEIQAFVAQLVETCRSKSAAVAESLNLCFDRRYRIEARESRPWDPADVPVELDGPGLVSAFGIGSHGMLVLIPESLPLPAWYAAPGDSEESRLQTLAMEWSMSLVPSDLEISSFLSSASSSLRATVEQAEPLEGSADIALAVFEQDAPEGSEPAAILHVVWPVERPPLKAESNAAAVAPAAAALAHPRPAPAGPGRPSQNARRLLKLPVTIAVHLAAKKIEMKQLLAISPGALITFNKSCEDLLDLYVNNHRYCRGEAVKIGEKFGLKINEVGVAQGRREPLL